MIVSAAVKFKMSDGREITMPMNWHGDAYQIMHDLGFKPNDFTTISQGFLYSIPDPDDKFNTEYGYIKDVKNTKGIFRNYDGNGMLLATGYQDDTTWWANSYADSCLAVYCARFTNVADLNRILEIIDCLFEE